MANFRDHAPVVLNKFMGKWNRGDPDETPLDHFQDCNNLKFYGSGSFTVRDGIGPSQNVAAPLNGITRIYNYPTQTANTLLILQYSGGVGNIYHFVNSTTIFGPILTITGMADFAFQPYAGRAYISPFASQPPTYSAPVTAPTLTGHSGSGIEDGVHQYAVTFATSTLETTASPLATITNTPLLANPTVTPTGSTVPISTSYLTPSSNYKFQFTYTLNNNLTETNVGPASANINSGTGNAIIIANPGTFPAGVKINIYMTQAGGSTYHRLPAYTNIDPTLYFNFTIGDTIAYIDATVATYPVAPSANNTQVEQVNVNNIPIGPAINGITITQRNIYRTSAGGTQLKFLHTIADNTTTTYVDSASDSTLGANVPTINTIVVQGDNHSIGLQGQFVYVYAGDGTPARKAAGLAIGSGMTAAAGIAGHTDAGLHVYGVVSETVSGYLSPPGSLTTFTNLPGNSVSFGNIPTSGDPNVVARFIVASKAISTYNGDPTSYQLFFIPNATINNNTDTFLNNVSFFDADLLSDASYLSNNYQTIPAGAVMATYHNSLVIAATYNDISLALVSAAGQPEAISQVNGLLIYPLDGDPITNAVELRDTLYMMKRSSTRAWQDNGGTPSTWPMISIDNALGTSVHGIAAVLNNPGSTNVDYIIIATYQGLTLFNGRYIIPELTWKIEADWRAIDRTKFDSIQIVNAPIQKEIYVVLPNGSMIVGNYSIKMDYKNMRWTPFTAMMQINCIAIYEIDEIIIGA